MVAEVFLAVWRRLDELPADPLPWVLRIARGVLANRRRADERREALIARLISERPSASEPVEGNRDFAIVRALSTLRTSDQELLLLVAWERLSTEQLAATLGVSRGTVAVRVHRARRRLRRAVAVAEQKIERTRTRASEMEVLDG